MNLIDTHCHIHESTYPIPPDDALRNASNAGVIKMICVGTNERSSFEAVAFAKAHANVYATIGVHPHDTKDGWKKIKELTNDTSRLVGVGEIGLDYFYTHSPRETQIKALEEQIDFAIRRNLPIVFHVREAFDDFWPIFDNFSGIRGELHSFTDSTRNLEEGMKRGLFVGVNGISTFTKDIVQQQMFAHIPLEKLLLETDAPFLTPVPFRGKVNEPAFVKNVAEFHAHVRDIPLEEITEATTTNAETLFAL